MKRRVNSASTLSSSAQLWLEGKPCGFFASKPASELAKNI